MKQGGRPGCVINVASTAAVSGDGPAHYCASKAALMGLTRSMAKELASAGIRVNTLVPGPHQHTDDAGHPSGVGGCDRQGRAHGRMAEPTTSRVPRFRQRRCRLRDRPEPGRQRRQRIPLTEVGGRTFAGTRSPSSPAAAAASGPQRRSLRGRGCHGGHLRSAPRAAGRGRRPHPGSRGKGRGGRRRRRRRDPIRDRGRRRRPAAWPARRAGQQRHGLFLGARSRPPRRRTGTQLQDLGRRHLLGHAHRDEADEAPRRLDRQHQLHLRHARHRLDGGLFCGQGGHRELRAPRPPKVPRRASASTSSCRLSSTPRPPPACWPTRPRARPPRS